MRIIRYLKNCKVAVLLIVCLLVVQAFTDLALPHYTSDIVDVGIQQSGVEHAATDEMTAKTHDEIAMMLPVDDEQTFRDAYTETDDGTYKLNDQGKKEQEELDRMVALPLVAIHYSSQIPDLDLDQVMQAYEAGAIDKQKILDMLDEAKQHMGGMGDSIVDQQAIAAAKAEYESLGYNLSDMQMGYLVRIGLLMLGLAALGMVAAVLVGFIASATHLGTPANALHVFSGVGRSPLSNEVLSAVAFLFLVGSYWMMAFKERFPDAVAKPWLALACLAGIALIACTSMAYNVDTVPTWDTAFTPANLVLAALLAGPVLGLLFLELAEYFVRIPELFPVENKSWNTVFFSPFQNISIRDITKDRFYAELRFLSKILNDIFSVRT